jgi:hypothetical protein
MQQCDSISGKSEWLRSRHTFLQPGHELLVSLDEIELILRPHGEDNLRRDGTGPGADFKDPSAGSGVAWH